MACRDLEYWRRFFSNEKCDVFELIESGIMVAAVDCPNELTLRRGRIAELLFSCESKRCVGCEHVELCVPLVGQNDDDHDDDGPVKFRCDDDDGRAISYGDVEALNEEIEEESRLVREVLRIKDVLTNSQDESESEIYESLRRLQYMALTVDILKSTEIGKAVNGLRKHSSSDVRCVAKQLIQVWKQMVDEWVNATTLFVDANNKGTPDSINPSVLDEEEGLPSPPMDEGALFATPQTMELSQFFDGMDDYGNLRNSGELSKNFANGRKLSNDNQSITNRMSHSTNDANTIRKEHNSLHERKNQATVSQPRKPSITHSGPGRPHKTNTDLQTSSLVKHRQSLDKASSQRMPLAAQHQKSNLQVNLETAKRKLQERYQEAENAKRQRTIKVLDTIPKQAVVLKKPQGRSGKLNQQQLFGYLDAAS